MIKRGSTPGWFYVSIYHWRPFKFLMHGGWIFLNWRWFWQYLWTVPKSRGWRWG